MPHRPSRPARAIAAKTAELATAVPQVVAHRLTRMAIAGPRPSARDQREFTRMVAEKNAAFVEACQAMAVQSVVAQQALALSWMRAFWSPALRGPSPLRAAAQVQAAALGVVDKGLAPVHRKATANARRLAKTRLR